MYFLRWLYREVNPMILVLGLALLYFLLNGIFGSKTAPELDSASENVVVAPVKAIKDQVTNNGVEPQQQVKQDTAVVTASAPDVETKSNDAEHDNNSEILVTPAASDGEKVAVSIDANEVGSSSVFSRLFKKPAQEPVVSTPEVVASAATAATVIAAAPVVETTSSSPEVVSAKEPDVDPTVVEQVSQAVAQVEGVDPARTAEEAANDVDISEGIEQDEPSKKGGFLGLFGGNNDKQDDAPAAESASEATATGKEVVAETAVVPSADSADERREEEQQATLLPPAPAPVKIVAADMQKLATARRAYWDREYAQADSLYNELINAEPSNADLISEYGNMLLQSGQVEKTLNVYEKAAGLMIESGRKQDAKPLIDYISSWDKDRGDQLINRVFAQ